MPDEDKSPGLEPIGDQIAPSAAALGALELRPLLEVPDYVHRTHTLCEILRTVAILCLVLGVLISLSARQGE